METIKKSPKIAILFGLVAIITSIILIIDASKVINYVFSLFWLITGLLGLYLGLKR